MSDQVQGQRVQRRATVGEAAPANQAPAEAGGIAAAAPVLETRSSTTASAGENPDLLTRRSRFDSSGNDFEIPNRFKKPGWDYEWKTVRVNGQDVDDSELAFYHEQGWRVVEASAMPGYLPPGSQAKQIVRKGQIMMTRPLRLTMEAKQEDYKIAEQQKADKLASASSVPVPRPGAMHAIKDTFQIEGEVGTHKKGAAA